MYRIGRQGKLAGHRPHARKRTSARDRRLDAASMSPRATGYLGLRARAFSSPKIRFRRTLPPRDLPLTPTVRTVRLQTKFVAVAVLSWASSRASDAAPSSCVAHIGSQVRKAGRGFNYIFIAFFKFKFKLGRKNHGHCGPAAVTGPGRVPVRVPLIIKGHVKMIGNLRPARLGRTPAPDALVGSEFNASGVPSLKAK